MQNGFHDASELVDVDEEFSAEMVTAGALEFARHDPRFETGEEAVVRIYRAMILKRDGRLTVKPSTDTARVDAICT
jgi:hypothetical protein